MMITQLARTVAYVLLSALQFMMIAMAVMSWIPQMHTSRIYQTINMMVEPLLMPIRKLLWRIPALRSFPLDLSFLILWMIIAMIQRLL